MNKYFFILLILMITSILGYAQIGGLSGSKLDAFCVDVVDHHKVEFEPAVYHFESHYEWDKDGKLVDRFHSSDSIKQITGMAFRFTYGLWNKLELGMSISTDFELSYWGARYVLVNKQKFGFALMAGAKIPFGNKTIDRSLRYSNNLSSVGAGIVASSQLNKDFSIDFNAQYMTYVGTTAEGNKGSYYLNADAGYYFFSHQLQLIAGFGYQISRFDGFDNKILTFYPGITVETGKNYIIVLAVPFDIYGVNAEKVGGISLALTLTFD